MKSTRLPYLGSHLPGINRSIRTERRRFARLFPIACLSLACGFAYAWRAEQSARLEVEALLSDERITYVLKDPVARPVTQPPLSTPSKPRKSVSTPTVPKEDAVHLIYRTHSDSGIELNETETGLSFVW